MIIVPFIILTCPRSQRVAFVFCSRRFRILAFIFRYVHPITEPRNISKTWQNWRYTAINLIRYFNRPLSVTVLSAQNTITKYHRQHELNNRNYFSQFWRSGIQDDIFSQFWQMGVLDKSVSMVHSGESFLLGLQMDTF